MAATTESTECAQRLPYRADIDGLRAVAVVGVVLYHAGFPLASGGFAGVDVFFVISGFLIARMLHADLQTGQFSVQRFYEHRILRIFPALFVVLATCSALAWAVLPPPDIETLGHSLAASALFLANLYFLEQGSYDGLVGQQSPLLHIWSLSLEEQFYLVFPWLLLACRRWLKSRYVIGLAVPLVLSLVLSVGLASRSEAAAFYFSGSRAWELLLGALLVFAPAWTARLAWMAAPMGLAGLGLVLLALSGSILNLMPAGTGAVVPCAGAALALLAGGHGGFATAVLSLRPLVFVGLISYSLYLWHWPLLVFHRALRPFEPGGESIVIALSFLLAALTWRLVEQPVRRIGWRGPPVWRLAGVSLSLLLLAALLLVATRGGDWRLAPPLRWLYSFDTYGATEQARQGACFLAPGWRNQASFDRENCLPQVAGKPSYLLIGDSHAAHLWHGLARALPEVTLQRASASACRPLLDGQRAPACTVFLQDILNPAVPATRPEAVILAARWSEADIEPLRKTIRVLLQSTAKVFVLGPAVEYREALPRVLALAQRHGDASMIDRARVPGIAELDRIMADRLQDSGATYLSVYRVLCPLETSGCLTVTPSGVPVQFDYGHLTREGAAYVGDQLRDSILSR